MADIKVLYVDDESVNLFLFEKMFEEEFKVVCANSGSEALEIIENDSEIKIVFSDMNMPSMNGIEFIKEAKPKHPHLNYFILTGYDINEEIKEALNNGLLMGYLEKPFDKEKIIETALS